MMLVLRYHTGLLPLISCFWIQTQEADTSPGSTGCVERKVSAAAGSMAHKNEAQNKAKVQKQLARIRKNLVRVPLTSIIAFCTDLSEWCIPHDGSKLHKLTLESLF